MRRTPTFFLIAGLAVFLPSALRSQQSSSGPTLIPSAVHSTNRILGPINDQVRVVLPGNRHPLAAPEADLGPVPPDFELEEMILVLRPDSKQETALATLLAGQQDRASPAYHRWLTPEEFADRFGVSPGDLIAIFNWLKDHGLTVDSIPKSQQAIVFSGTAAAVESAFHTTLRNYAAAGEVHFTNATDPQIPAALAPVIEGVASLNDFAARSPNTIESLQPAYDANYGYHYLAPVDFATIYNIAPLYSEGLDGSGQTIAIVARSNIDVQDVRTFRTTFGLPPKDPAVRLPGRDPGIGDSDDQAEATVAVEWAGAIAPNATILLVPVASTGATDGASLAAQYVVNKALASILSMSFTNCEAHLGAAGNSFFLNLWQQAAAEGITVLVSSGDSGAAGCDASDAPEATSGRAVNGICSTPEATCIGGTEFEDTASSSFWNPRNNAANGSAISYIPEMAWNESAGTTLIEPSGYSIGSGLLATGGGASAIYAKPSWQTAAGVPSDGRRDVPDIALAAAAHDGYLVQLDGISQVFHGTSMAVPSFAGLLALIEQRVGQSADAGQGNINPALYSMASQPYGTSVFHDVTSGDNGVPGLTGFTATAGYDLTTGLGSIDAQNLLASWNADAGVAPQFTLALSPANIRLIPGKASIVTVNLTSGNAAEFSSATVSVAVAALPAGITAQISTTTVTIPGKTYLAIKANRTARAGIYSVQVNAVISGFPSPAPASIIVTLLPAGVRRTGPIPAGPALPISP